LYSASTLIGDEDRWRKAPERYYPMGYPEIPHEFAKIADGTDEEIIAFCNTYGLLGFGDGEPLDWIRGHAANVKLVLEIAGSLNDQVALARLVDPMIGANPDPSDATGEKEARFSYFRRGERCASGASIGPHLRRENTAIQIMHMILSDNLTGITRSLLLAEESHSTKCSARIKKLRIESGFRFKSLMDCIYWLLTDAVLSGTIKKCGYCHRQFFATHGRMNYCPPRKGIKGISPCANRGRVYRCRKKKQHETSMKGTLARK